jgi:hypothetical protein
MFERTGRTSSFRRGVIRITGSDTMVNLVQAWADNYKSIRPAVTVQVTGGGSGVGIAGLIDGTVDLAAASREIRSAERERASDIVVTPWSSSSRSTRSLCTFTKITRWSPSRSRPTNICEEVFYLVQGADVRHRELNP